MKKIFDGGQVKEIDRKTIEEQGISSVDLMEKASLAVYNSLKGKIDPKRVVYIFAGPGNNGGDALALARMLLTDGTKVFAYIVNPDDSLSPDCRINKERLERLIRVNTIISGSDIPNIKTGNIIVDGLFGSGLNRPLTGVYKEVVSVINNSESEVYSIDIPSGMFMEDNTDNDRDAIVKSGTVFSFQFPKLALLLPESDAFCRTTEILNIGLSGKTIETSETDYFFIEKEDISPLIKTRSHFAHKGDFGKVLLVTGSLGKMGASVMASKACLRTGTGLLTVHVPRCGTDILQTTVPEAMVDADQSIDYVSKIDIDTDVFTIGIGPGIGMLDQTKELVHKMMKSGTKPMVIDADALNLISTDNHLKKCIPPESILTPHPLEFDRLAGKHFSNGYERLQAAREFAGEYNVYVILKGAYIATITPTGKVFFNSTGNPGMATGGSGDVLTGIITSLLSQKYTPLESALLGVYLHGLSGDLSAKSKTQQSMLPSDIIENIGRAYRILQNRE